MIDEQQKPPQAPSSPAQDEPAQDEPAAAAAAGGQQDEDSLPPGAGRVTLVMLPDGQLFCDSNLVSTLELRHLLNVGIALSFQMEAQQQQVQADAAAAAQATQSVIVPARASDIPPFPGLNAAGGNIPKRGRLN